MSASTDRKSSAIWLLASVRFCIVATLLITSWGWITPLGAAEPFRLFRMSRGNPSPYDQRQQIISELPLDRLTAEAKEGILAVAKSPTLYRRLPTQAITCEPEMFLFLTRQPEVMVGIWELMGITQVQTQRTGPYHLTAEDGSGTNCEIDLVYGDTSLHLYTAEGSYDGPLVAGTIKGRGVFVLRSSYARSSLGQTTVTGTIDCFVQIDNLGADLIARTFSGLIGRSADYNFVETARFMSQVSLASQQNTSAMVDIANRISQVEEPIRSQFVGLISEVSKKPSALRVQPLFEDRFPQEGDSYQSVGIEPNSPQLQPETSASGPLSKLTPDEQTSDPQTPDDRQASSQVDALIR